MLDLDHLLPQRILLVPQTLPSQLLSLFLLELGRKDALQNAEVPTPQMLHVDELLQSFLDTFLCRNKLSSRRRARVAATAGLRFSVIDDVGLLELEED